ncbi:transcriptional regulator [Pedobacter sp. BAL39]|nr:transcriptional regulator [Pedobacter sp. BAL39]
MANLYELFELDHPVQNPLISVVDFSQVKGSVSEDIKISADYYSIMFKNTRNNNVKYGRKTIDFQGGSLICMAPNQVLGMDVDTEASDNITGWGLFFHPDLISAFSLNDRMKEYTFFNYETSEALHLSEKERQVLYECVLKIETELQENIDVYSQTIMVSSIELLLNYCSRYYGRQFITRKSLNHAVVGQIEKIMTRYYHENHEDKGLLTVKYLAEKVNLSPSYLSDLLKKETGKNAQDHIHFYLIQEGKNMLLSTSKSVTEIAYKLGFEYPQYFSKLFKQKTGKTPIEFRSIN